MVIAITFIRGTVSDVYIKPSFLKHLQSSRKEKIAAMSDTNKTLLPDNESWAIDRSKVSR